MKASEVSLDTVKNYINVHFNDDDILIDTIMLGARSYIRGYTGLTDLQIDTHEDITIAFMCLCADMYDNRQIITDNDKQNPIVTQILSMYSTNYF